MTLGKVRIAWKWVILGVIALTGLAVLVIEHTMQAVTIEYPLNTWRMDLDDAVTTATAMLAAIAGIIAALAAWRKAGKLEHKFNGGMSSLAGQIIADELRTADIEVGLHRRVQVLEDSEAECLKLKEECLEENEGLRDWVIDQVANHQCVTREEV